MCRTPFTARIHGRYVFRRRVHFRNIISKPLPIALQTADPKVARKRAALLSARFVLVKGEVDAMLEGGRSLTGPEIEALFRQKLEEELNFYVNSAYEDASWSSSVPDVAAEEAEAYRILRLPNRHNGMTDGDRARLHALGMENAISSIEEYMAQIRDMLDDESIARRLAAIGAPTHSQNIAAARGHIIRAGAVACSRVAAVFDDATMDAPDPIRALIADLGEPTPEVKALLGRTNPAANIPAAVAPVSPTAQSECLFMIYDDRRFGDVIDDVIAELKADGVWKGQTHQQRRIMETFAWITGNRPLGSYNHMDAPRFKQGIQKMPTSFRFGSLTEGAMSRPFEDVVAELPALAPGDRRSNKTVNRDLSFMATVSKHLGKTAWRPKVPGAQIMDFSGVRIAIKAENSADLRPAWTRPHMEILFQSPLYLGGGGALRRLKPDGPVDHVWHDAAYFAPLIWYYTSACREEICGLELADLTVDHQTPYIEIRDNLTRGRDGEKAGEKRAARRRHLPVHPELIRLGFFDYVEAIRKEGHVALFPELYPVAAEKRGGAFFYERAWQHMVDYIEDRLPLPISERGKGPDIHSIRALGSSFYEIDGVNENIRADVMGHARQGTNGKHYSKRIQTEGLDVVLAERLIFIERYIPVITANVANAPIRLLPLEKRSRVGSSRERKERSDAGHTRRSL
ncbi:hypothetical protein sphantq_03507 [Sphingobium sp. AntQ-1]|uniref:hypothetical protein n=1 Tax=Sphingobium sp. AntQ-1 TaxID=2930091 RepID=UPI00234E8307|nr:hypothetical protein [Sphingobium sp. AntQ-1]WCP15052.1 hypothetical protein sphantq_03507 [Sphingobium sp. AntQ-1]